MRAHHDGILSRMGVKSIKALIGHRRCNHLTYHWFLLASRAISYLSISRIYRCNIEGLTLMRARPSKTLWTSAGLLSLAAALTACVKGKVEVKVAFGAPVESTIDSSSAGSDQILNSAELNPAKPLITISSNGSVRSMGYLAVKSDIVCDASIKYAVDPPTASTTYLTSDGSWKVCVSITATNGQVSFLESQTFEVDFTNPVVSYQESSNPTSPLRPCPRPRQARPFSVPA